MAEELAPLSVLITGANSGLGLEFVKQFVNLPKPPTFLFASCRSPTRAQELAELAAQHSSVKILKLDVCDMTTITDSKAMVESYVGLDGLNLIFNNAGNASFTNITDVTQEEMTNLFNVNAVGPLMVIKMFLPLLQQAAKTCPDFTISRSAVINITSDFASITENDSGEAYAYRTSKAALNMITKTASLDLKHDGILISAIHPGWVQTKLGGPDATYTPTASVKLMMCLMSTFQSDAFTGEYYYTNSGSELLW